MDNKLTKSGQNRKQLRITRKQEHFLEYVANGMPMVEAQVKAGFKPSYSNARRLITKWTKEFKEIQENQGFTKPHIVGKLLKLLSLPCIDKDGLPIKGVTVEQFKEIAKLLASLLPERQEKPHITQFVINRYSNGTNGTGHSVAKEPIDVEAISISDPRPEA